jgi:hypothetical protein
MAALHPSLCLLCTCAYVYYPRGPSCVASHLHSTECMSTLLVAFFPWGHPACRRPGGAGGHTVGGAEVISLLLSLLEQEAGERGEGTGRQGKRERRGRGRGGGAHPVFIVFTLSSGDHQPCQGGWAVKVMPYGFIPLGKLRVTGQRNLP